MINLAQVLGRVGKLNVNTMRNGTKVANLSMVTNKKFAKDGQKHEKATWHNISIFGKLAEIAEKYVAVGDLLYIQGEMDSQKYTGQDGIERNKSFIVASDLKLMPRAKEQSKPQQAQAINNEFSSFPDEHIPF